MLLSFFADLKYAIDAIIRMETKMGAIAKATKDMPAKLDKIAAEFERAKAQGQEPDADDLAALAAVRERLQRLDDMNADQPDPDQPNTDQSGTGTDTDTSDQPGTPDQPADITPEPAGPTAPLQAGPEPTGSPENPSAQ